MIRPEFVENPEPRCPVVLVLDTSESMEGEPIEALNEALASFKYDAERHTLAALRVEVAIVTFGETVQVLQDFVTIDHLTTPSLVTAGRTPLGEAMDRALDLLEERKQMYRESGVPYYRPWMVLITDGAPTDGDRWRQASARLKELEAKKKIVFFPVGVKGADMTILAEMASDEYPPLQVGSMDFQELFVWLSASVSQASVALETAGSLVSLPVVKGWST